MNEYLILTPPMIAILVLLGLVVVLLISERVRADVAALAGLVGLGVLSMLPALDGLYDVNRLFAGFSSNAVIALVSVMVMGAGLQKTGLVQRTAEGLLQISRGFKERSVVALLSAVAGALSAFVQNAAATALFLPVVYRISARTGIARGHLLLPIGYAITLGGTVTLIGASPLIMLNDLLPAEMEPFSLFAVAPVGLALLATGILYFFVTGSLLLPPRRAALAVVVPTPAPPTAQPAGRPKKMVRTLLWLALSIGLIVGPGWRLSEGLMVGALGMVLTGVLTMDEAYRAISWRTVILLGSLMPLGFAAQETGAALWVAQHALTPFEQAPVWLLQLVLAVVTTLFALTITHVGATVLLVPFAIQLAVTARAAGLDADPRLFALIVAVVSSNGFLLPTNPVIAMVMGPGRYRIKELLRAGLGMTVLFIAVALTVLNLLF